MVSSGACWGNGGGPGSAWKCLSHFCTRPHNTLGGDLDVAIGRAMRVRGPYSVSHNAQLKMALDTAVYVRTLRLECETKNWPRVRKASLT